MLDGQKKWEVIKKKHNLQVQYTNKLKKKTKNKQTNKNPPKLTGKRKEKKESFYEIKVTPSISVMLPPSS